jgi:hypothetical protein
VKRARSEARPAHVDRADDGPESDADPRVAAFLRGVTIGALVGAAIAGSALWERALRRRERSARGSAEDEGTPPS